MAIGCIGEEFDLDGHRLILLGPRQAVRPGGLDSSGLYADEGGLRVTSSNDIRPRTLAVSSGKETIAAGQWHAPFQPKITVSNTSSALLMISGTWRGKTSIQVPEASGTLWVCAEPARYAYDRPPAVAAYQQGSLASFQDWHAGGVWPVTEVIAPGEELSLYLNLWLRNEMSDVVTVAECRASFHGLSGPAGSGEPIGTMGQVAEREAGRTLSALAAASTGLTLQAVGEEWSRTGG
ncbi:hypothetical protein RCO28_37985 [Streptomyces sp. LHD-70]|uniref:hypothetical protein n=1 Tax=Streptomyces sp. LHD-70 TaxID=3072140 RepID=UPI00280F2985|nr:hypothetical protein [Streptomyces sp. LHD-70]MDQ8708209.1 hypothetical protein [Streptomyces sp. LHD-70]